MPLDINVEECPEYWILTLVGDLDYGECPYFRINLDRVLMKAPPALIVDLSGVMFMDSSGLGVLLASFKHFAGDGKAFVLVTNDSVDKILAISHLESVFTTVKDVDQALQVVR